MKSDPGSFNEKCYRLLQLVPKGKVTTYGEIAKAMKTRAWRAVGSAMAKNRQLIVIPCHRVVRSNGEIGQYALGPDRKAELLIKEGVTVANGRVADLDSRLHRFSV